MSAIAALLFSLEAPALDLPQFLRTTDGSVMALVPRNQYLIGTDDGPADARPAHKVMLEAFYIDQTEVTNKQYLQFCQATGHRYPPRLAGGKIPPGMENLPVVNVSFNDADEYARWAKKSLPTEEQWEAAARGFEKRIYSWGNVNRPWIAALNLKNPAPVASYPEDISPFVIYDMGGNVMEWTSSWYKSYPEAPAWFDQAGKKKVARGGGFCPTASDASTFIRRPLVPNTASDCLGFRCVREIRY